MEILGKILGTVIVVIGIFILGPALAADIHDETVLEAVKVGTVKFCDEVKEQGRITQEMYNSFIKELDATGELYNIEIVYTRNVISPANQDGTGKAEAVSSQECFYTQDILAGIFKSEADGGDTIDGQADGILNFNAGDFISINVTNRHNTFAQKLYGMLMVQSPNAPRINVNTGGQIRDEV